MRSRSYTSTTSSLQAGIFTILLTHISQGALYEGACMLDYNGWSSTRYITTTEAQAVTHIGDLKTVSDVLPMRLGTAVVRPSEAWPDATVYLYTLRPQASQ